MSDWKYIMFHVGDQDVPIIFPGTMVHKDVADAAMVFLPVGKFNVVAAGHIPGLQVLATEGLSETLKLSARPEDADLINTYPYAHGRPDQMPHLEMPKLVAMAFLDKLMKKLNI